MSVAEAKRVAFQDGFYSGTQAPSTIGGGGIAASPTLAAHAASVSRLWEAHADRIGGGVDPWTLGGKRSSTLRLASCCRHTNEE